jgi:uracil phosphoribosyltransferase
VEVLAKIRLAPAEEVVDRFGVKVDLTRRVEVRALGKEARLFRVDLDVPGEVYILDSLEGVEIASQPEIVGVELSSKALSLARKASRVLLSLLGGREAVFLHVLRSSPGYMLHEALKSCGASVREVYVRVSSHSSPGGGNVTFSLMGRIPGEIKDVIVADTVATGQTLESALRFLLKMGELKGVKFRRVFAYGFLSEEGVRRVGGFLEGMGLQPVFVAIEDLTALASNNFDMPLYGPDIGSSDRRLLGGVTDMGILEKMIDAYFPGIDQPGDWSERQCILFNGESMEYGRIREHLEKSLSRLEALRSELATLGWYPEWLEGVYARRRSALLGAMPKQHCPAWG